MVSVTTSFFETLIASNGLFGVVDSTDGSTYSANLFVVAVAFLLGIWMALNLILWGAARYKDSVELARRVKFGLRLGFRRRAPEAARRLRVSFAACFAVGVCSWILLSKQTEEVSEISSITVEKSELLNDVSYVKNAVASGAASLADFVQTTFARYERHVPANEVDSENALEETKDGAEGRPIEASEESDEEEPDESFGDGQHTIAFVNYVNNSADSENVSQNWTRSENNDAASSSVEDVQISPLRENQYSTAPPAVASELKNEQPKPSDNLRVEKPILSSALDDTFFYQTVVSRGENPLVQLFNAGAVNTSGYNKVQQTSVIFAPEDNKASFIGQDSVGTVEEDKTILERIDEESNRIGAFIRRFVVAIEVTHKATSSQKDEDETGAGFLTTYLGRTFVITNYHVVDEIATKDAVRIYASNNEPFSPKKILTCPELDIAVLEIDPKQLPSDGSWSCCVFGDSSTVQVANAVFAVGSPFGLEKSIAYGHVSSLRRCNQDLVRSNANKLPEYFQLDAAINPGNSGGPLCNTRGEVIGIVTAIATTSGKNEGVAFAIPSNMFLRVVKTLVDKGEWRRSRLGVELSPATRADLSSTGLTGVFGAKIHDIQRGSPAGQAGLHTGDVIIAFNGDPVADDLQLSRQIAIADPEEKARLSVVRGNRFFEMEVSLRSAHDSSRK